MKKLSSIVLCCVLMLTVFSDITVLATDTDIVHEEIIFAYNLMQKYCDPVVSDQCYSNITSEQLSELKTVARNTVKNCNTDYDKIKALYNYVADTIYYDYDYYYDKENHQVVTDAYGVYKCKKTVCSGYTNLFLALCDTVNIPCMKLHSDNHVYNSAYDCGNTRWIVLDTTWGSRNSYKNSQFIYKGVTDSRFDLSPDSLYSIGDHEMYMDFSFPYNHVFYTIDDDFSLYVDGVTDSNYTGKITIAESVEGKPVTKIPDYTFYKCNKFTGVSIPNTITYIGRSAFYECTSLKKVLIPDGVKTIGDWAFGECSALTSATIGNDVTSIGNDAFYNCSSLKSLVIPNSVKTIGEWAFGNCTSLATLKLGAGVTKIGNDAFCGCSLIKSLVIPDSVKSIGEWTFGKCSSLENVKIGNSVTSLGSHAFYNCAALVNIFIPNSVNKIGDKAFDFCNNPILAGYSNSTAQKYAADNGFKFFNCSSVLKLVSAVNSAKGVTVTWGKVANARGYVVYRKAENATSWTKIATVTGVSTLTYTDGSAKSGTTYTYTVRAYRGYAYSNYQKTGKTVYFLAQPSFSLANQNGSVKVSWSKVSGAKQYNVYRKNGSDSSWTKIGATTGNSFVDKNVKSGTMYKYTVKAINGKSVGSYNDGINIKYLSQPKLGTPISAKSGVTVKWSKVSGASGYIVYRKNASGSWSKLGVVKGNTTVSYLDKSAVKGTTYVYTVRAYYSSNYSACNTNGVSIKDKY